DGMNTIAQPKVIQDKKHSKPLDIRHGAIEFNHVDFEYTLGEQVLKDLSLNIKAGEKIGLVGRSGAGKSTLVNLLLRFHDLNRGSIRIDGQDV
ncbi:ATP-binding cassette domain-containing protein, partial [Oleiphilus sp. HI0079]